MTKKVVKKTRKNIDKKYLFPYLEEMIMQEKKIEGCRPSTIRNYTKFFKQFEKCFGEPDVRELNLQDAKNFITFLIDEGLENTTINNYLNCAKSSFEILKKEGLCENIFREIKRLKTDTKNIEILTTLEIKAFLKAMDKSKYNEFRDFVLVNVLLDTMGRIEETITLREKDVDFEKKAITFNKTKGRKTRTVPVTKKTLSLLRELIDENDDFESDQIFLSVSGQPLEKSARDVSTKLKEYARRAGINKRVHFHLFRHTAASHFLEKSQNIRMLQLILGHSDISITQVYAHVLDQHILQSVESFSILNELEGKKKLKRRTTK